jgi:FkbM family methyltransferase
VRVRARGRVLEIPLDSYHDLLTVNEVFFRRDYRASPLATTVVDVGSNVGISALYFLTLNERCRVYLYEPVPRNLQRLRVNLRGFEGRWRVDAVAVGTRSGVVEFGWEASGRYGGVGRRLPHRMHVACRDINDVLAEVIAERGAIDVLKVDVEGTESALIRHIDPTHLMRIGAIYAECDGRSLDLPGFRRRQWGSVARFRRSVS